jgi:hypothetical protein
MWGHPWSAQPLILSRSISYKNGYVLTPAVPDWDLEAQARFGEG